MDREAWGSRQARQGHVGTRNFRVQAPSRRVELEESKYLEVGTLCRTFDETTSIDIWCSNHEAHGCCLESFAQWEVPTKLHEFSLLVL